MNRRLSDVFNIRSKDHRSDLSITETYNEIARIEAIRQYQQKIDRGVAEALKFFFPEREYETCNRSTSKV